MNRDLLKSKLKYQEAFAASIAFSIGIALYLWLDTFYAYWLPMMIATMFALSSRGSVIKRSHDRIFGTFLGVCAAFCFAGSFLFIDFQWVYVLPAIWFLIFYIQGTTGSPALPALATAMFIPIIDDITENQILQSDRVFLQRLIFTSVAIAIGLICEHIIYKNAASNSSKMKYNTRSLFNNMANILSVACSTFKKDEVLKDEQKYTLLSTMDSISSMESVYSSLRFELSFEGQQVVLKEIFFKIQRINVHLRKILCFVNHSKLEEDYLSEDKLIYFDERLADKFNNITNYFYGRKDNLTHELFSFLLNTNVKFKHSPTYFYLKELYYLSVTVDSVSSLIYHRKSYNEQ
ncbi:MAG TPA: FUSC family protein [Victivallales bacterium]|nr:FUSC family protein [Victivallales bacterium]